MLKTTTTTTKDWEKNIKEQKSALNHWQKEKDVACGPTERLWNLNDKLFFNNLEVKMKEIWLNDKVNIIFKCYVTMPRIVKVA